MFVVVHNIVCKAKLHIKTAAFHHSKFHLNPDKYTTSSYFQIKAYLCSANSAPVSFSIKIGIPI